MAKGPDKALRQDILEVTRNKQGWFMAKDINEGVAKLRGKKIHNISLGWELGFMAGDGLLDRRKVTRQGSDYGSWEYLII